MKRRIHVWWFIINIEIAVTAILLITLFLIMGNATPSQNSTGLLNPAFTANLLTSQNSGDSSSSNEDDSSKQPQPVFLTQAASVSSVNGSFLAARRITPYWEKSASLGKPLPLENFFIPVLIIRVFAIFYRLAQTGPGDDLPDRGLVEYV
ncbi:MAG TPA: hypothetical protein VHY08_14495 [Bacillota bacterium]|nr:hypothetical protein [Bacillota bacterium]